MIKNKLLILLGALLLAPVKASLIPDSFPWKPFNIDYNGETCIYDYEPQPMEYATTLYLGDGYSSMDSLIRSARRHNLPEPIRVIVSPGVYRNSWSLQFDFDGAIECASEVDRCVFKSNRNYQPAIKAKNFILKNIDFIGGNTGLFFRANNQGGRKDIISCTFCNSLKDDGLSIRDSGDFYIYKSEASYNMQDGFDVHNIKLRALTRVIELDVTCFETGYRGTASNCSTAHEDVIIIRVNGYYSFANDRVINDIQQSQTLMINNYVGDSRRHGNFNGAMFFGNKFAHIIGLDIEAQDINFYAGVIGVKEELK